MDTNVAFSASESLHPVSDACRRVMETMFEGQHYVVLSATQFMEWQKHQSGYSKRWLVRMKARKLWHILAPEPDSGLAARAKKIACTEEVRQEILKDLHLLENALATDRIVLSMETNVFRLFSEHKKVLKVPQPVAWVNPTDDTAACLAWIEDGAEVGKARCVPAST
ncbi:hypothetical protein [Hymenobacter terricola]|uniref:hypothetical protein n=1 Tax=Hymenobacter terricola TaxID=2819236 RepID=UPI001B313BDA|nr:hypothetical protein [Hymenobacter terricola]